MITIRRFKVSDTKKVASLVKNTFLKYNKKEGSKKGIENYLNLYSYKKDNIERLIISFSKSPIFFIALNKEKIVGIIRGDKDTITNLFVLGSYHKQGIAKKLMKKFEKECQNIGSKKIKIKASIFATSFYEKMGYKKTTGIRNFKDLKIQPMQKYLLTNRIK